MPPSDFSVLKGEGKTPKPKYPVIGTRKQVVHNKRQKPTLCFVVPYDELDWRTVLLTRQTQVQNAERLFREMERHNQELEKEAQLKAISKAHRLLEEV